MPAYSHLSDEERYQIGVMAAGGRSVGAIAKARSRSRSTNSRELRRNALQNGRYPPLEAAGAYQRRRRRGANPRKRSETQGLRLGG
jgi:transposase, IS30 family